MGWVVLYTAFGIVAVWLLGEVLLQYKARLRWRVLAFAGFSAVVLGVAVLSSVVVITLGAMAFAVGQTFVTLSYRRGFSTGWALGGKPGSSRRRREMEPEAPEAEPVLEVTELRTYQPETMVEETGEYGIYDRGDSPPPGQEIYADQQQYAPYSDPYPGYDTGQYATTAYDTGGYDSGAYATASYGYDANAGYGGAPYSEAPYGDASFATYGGAAAGYDPNGSVPQTPQYAPEAGAVHGSDGYGVQYDTGPYDPYGQYSQYGQSYPQNGQVPNAAYGDPYGHDPVQQQGYYSQTPPGAVWVPQQRETEEPLQNGQPYHQNADYQQNGAYQNGAYQNGDYPAGDGYWQPDSPRGW